MGPKVGTFDGEGSLWLLGKLCLEESLFGFSFGKNCGGNTNLSDVSRWDKLHSCPQLVPVALQLISIDLAFLIWLNGLQFSSLPSYI